MRIRPATADDAFDLAQLRWQWNREHNAVTEPLDIFGARFAVWVRTHEGTHEALVAAEGGEVIGMGEHPADAVRAKRDSSIVRGVTSSMRQASAVTCRAST